MAKEPKTNWSSFTKAELIRTIKALDRRQTTLLNQIAKLQAAPVGLSTRAIASDVFPWSTGSKLANPFEDVK